MKEKHPSPDDPAGQKGKNYKKILKKFLLSPALMHVVFDLFLILLFSPLIVFFFLKPKDQAVVLTKRLISIKLLRLIIVFIIFIILSPFILFFFLRPKPQTQIIYGVNFSDKYATQLGMDWKTSYINILNDLGVKNIRLVAYWDDIETERDIYDYSNILWQLEEAKKRDVNVIMTIGRKVPRYPECFEPDWWKKLDNGQERDSELYEYLETSVNILKKYNNIKMWQVENEPFFPFGECSKIKWATVKQEVEIVKALDDRPILIQDSGEGGFWLPSYMLGDNLAISMYRKIWYNFWGVFLGEFIYFQYPLAHWTYKIKADLVRVPYEKIVVTELQAEPWGPAINSELSEEDKNKTMSRQDFIATIGYAQKAGFKDLYFWGVEWWLWEKDYNDNPYYWDTAKALFN